MAAKKINSSFDKRVKSIVDKEINAIKRELADELKQTLAETLNAALGEMGLAGPLGAGLGNALDSIIAGKKVDARSVANAAAKQLAPQLNGFFNLSTAQSGEGLAGLFGAAQRNF